MSQFYFLFLYIQVTVIWSVVAMIAFIALPCAKCRCEGLGNDFCLDKQSFFHEDTDLDEQAGTIPDERQMPIKSKTTTTETKELEVQPTGRGPRGVTEKERNNSMSAPRKPQPTDKYDDEAMLAKFAEEEDVDREDHVTQIQYLSDLAVNTDNEITSLHAEEEPQQTYSNLAGVDRDPFLAFANDEDPSFYNEGVWTRAVRDVRSSEDPSSEESDESGLEDS